MKKRSKKLLSVSAGLGASTLSATPAAFAKVFCFFFSKKKNPSLPCLKARCDPFVGKRAGSFHRRVEEGDGATKYYLAVADRVPGEANWSILFPDFPGVTSVAERFADVVRQAKDALGTVVEDMERDGEALPRSVEDDAVPEYDIRAYHDPRTLLAPVEISGRALRVNVSLDEGLLARIDDVSKRTGLSRSAVLARGARMVIASEIGESG